MRSGGLSTWIIVALYPLSNTNHGIMKSFFSTAAAIAALLLGGSSRGHDNSQAPLTDDDFIAAGHSCEIPPYKMHLVSTSPLVIYLENFITPDERARLQKLAWVKS